MRALPIYYVPISARGHTPQVTYFSVKQDSSPFYSWQNWLADQTKVIQPPPAKKYPIPSQKQLLRIWSFTEVTELDFSGSSNWRGIFDWICDLTCRSDVPPCWSGWLAGHSCCVYEIYIMHLPGGPACSEGEQSLPRAVYNFSFPISIMRTSWSSDNGSLVSPNCSGFRLTVCTADCGHWVPGGGLWPVLYLTNPCSCVHSDPSPWDKLWILPFVAAAFFPALWGHYLRI